MRGRWSGPALLAAGLAVGCGADRSALVGRWDVSFTDGEERYPGWLEVRAEGDSLAGRFQGRFGHATPIAGIRSEGKRFGFSWPDEGDPSAPATLLEGEIQTDERLVGTMRSVRDTVAFEGRRAPPLTPRDAVAFGAEIDLLGDGLAGWQPRDPAGPNGWTLVDGELVNTPPSGDLYTTRRFTDFRLSLEVNVPPGGNSGVYLRGRHEVQVQDDAGRDPHSRRMGGVYGQVTPTALPALPAGEWQRLEIELVGRRVTVALNGVTVIDRVEIPGITGGALDSDEAAPGPIMLQGDHTGVRYRRIVLRPAED
ncbi:MAG: DUF1080 domain-containing protein [Gemmatimonadales bacterium]